LDAGALGVQVPNVDTKDEAASLVESVKYNPIGQKEVFLQLLAPLPTV